jgi:HD superfamily phosphohydrolase
MSGISRILDHLENDYTEPIRDPVWKHIYISHDLIRLMEIPTFQKLGRIKQLGPAYLVYPGATHTRLCHSLGVFHIARRLIKSLVTRAAREAPRDYGFEPTLGGVKAFLCAALLHDVGHYPFAHSLKDLDVEAHETLTVRLVMEEFAPALKGFMGVDPRDVAGIIDRKPDCPGLQNRFYRKILSGVLDPDKLDYLTRDAFFCGVPYGIQDVDFILEEVSPHREMGVAISPKGISALESSLFSKYAMYKTVYWHKTVRIATAMIKKSIAMGLVSGEIRREDLYGLDDEEFYAGFGSERFRGSGLIREVRGRKLYKQVFRVPFREGFAAHLALEDMEARLAREKRIADEAAAILGKPVPEENVVIDVPERISFDIDIPVTGEGGAAEDASAGPPEISRSPANIFSEWGAEDFTRSLRCISVAGRSDPGLLSALSSLDLSGTIDTL